MARPRKRRCVCDMPANSSFAPMGQPTEPETVIMAVEEYETIRLIDLAGYTQEDCADQMGIARTTVQGIYNDARRKLADVLVNGKRLSIEGGAYDICEGKRHGRRCGQQCCKRMKKELGDDRNE